MTNVELAWAAGILDGEGCIHIKKCEPTERSRHVSTTYNLILKVTMTHRPTIERLKAIFDFGFIQTPRKKLENPKWRRPWSWFASGYDAEHVLLLTQPFLFTKAEQARVALVFMCLPRARHGRRKVPEELTQRRHEFYLEMRRLKTEAFPSPHMEDEIHKS